MTFTNNVMKLVHFTLLFHLSLLCGIDQNFNSWDLKMHRFWQFFMRFFGIHLIFFSVLDNLFYGFAVSNRPQCSPFCSFLSLTNVLFINKLNFSSLFSSRSLTPWKKHCYVMQSTEQVTEATRRVLGFSVLDHCCSSVISGVTLSNGGKERGECAWLFWGRWHGLNLQTGQTSSLAPEIYQTFFNEGIDKENKNTHILILTVKVAPSVMMGWDGIKTDLTKNTRVS